MRVRPILRGLKTYLVPRPDRKGTGGTVSARYCYSVWLRHLVRASEAGVNVRPRVVAELGPGDSLGIGLAVLLSGAERYFGLDVVRHASSATNLAVFDDLVQLFARRADVPTTDELPEVRPLLDSYAFPAHLLTDSTLADALRPSRVEAIRAALQRVGDGTVHEGGSPSLEYWVPWHDPKVIQASTIDLLISQAVLEHVDDLDTAYDAMRRWLVPGGLMSHMIDFRSHGMTPEWNGHLEYPEGLWKLVKGRRSFLLNRQPWSVHLDLLRRHGFEILRVIRNERRDGLPASRLAPAFRGLSEEDARTVGAFVVAVKK